MLHQYQIRSLFMFVRYLWNAQRGGQVRIMDAQHAAAKQKLCLHPLESQAQGRFWYQPVVLDGVIRIVELFGRRFVLSLQAHNLPNRRRTMLSELSEHCSLKNFPLLKVKMLFEWVF